MIRLALAFLVAAGPALALDVTLPSNARKTVERNTSPDVFVAPIGVFSEGAVPGLPVEGDINRAAWRLASPGLTPLQVMRPLRDQLIAAGYEVVLDCDAQRCGGFDFRFSLETLPGPNMYVNVRAYHVVTGVLRAGNEVQDAVMLLTSTSATSAYVQIIHASVAGASNLSVTATESQPLAAQPDGSFTERLVSSGHAVLTDLDFASGSTTLGTGPFASLTSLAAYLKATPQMRVALVGHTDTVGGLQPNIAISRDRAQSVRQRLISAYDIAPGRLDAEGMGYLAPVANNLSATGRTRNRRVEVVLLGLAE